MGSLLNLQILEKNPPKYLLKKYVGLLMRVCQGCGKTPLDTIISKWQRNSPSRCLRCLPIVNLSHSVFSSYLGLSSKELELFSKNQLYCRALKALLGGINYFGLSRPQPTMPPIAIVWNLTNKCNLRCSHCYSDSVYNQETQSKELNTSQALRLVDYLAKIGVGSLSFSGGEPLLRKDFYTIAKRTSDHGLLSTLSTNGTMINNRIAEKIADTGISGVAISIDSLTPDFHDNFRGVKGAHAKALKGIEACANSGRFKEIIMAYTLTNNTIDDVPELLELANEMGVTRFYVSRILPVGRGIHMKHLNVTKPILKQLLTDLAGKFVKYANNKQGAATLTRGMTYFAPECARISNRQIFPISEIVVGFEERHIEILGDSAVPFFQKFAEYLGGCATGLTYCGLSPEGNVLPCAPAAGFNLGNIMENGLEKIWINNPVLQEVRQRSQIEGKCNTCQDKLICGGCRVTAYGETGNWLASDPSCPF